MINIFIGAILAISSFTIFHTSYRMNGINRVMAYLPMEIFENSVHIFSTGTYTGLYFNQSELIDALDEYFDTYVVKYANSYEAEYIFTNPSDQSICTTTRCQSIQINLTAEILSNYEYSKTMYYSITEA